MKVGEECDDGNSVVNDGCTNCVLDAGWLVHNYFKKGYFFDCYVGIVLVQVSELKLSVVDVVILFYNHTKLVMMATRTI